MKNFKQFLLNEIKDTINKGTPSYLKNNEVAKPVEKTKSEPAQKVLDKKSSKEEESIGEVDTQ